MKNESEKHELYVLLAYAGWTINNAWNFRRFSKNLKLNVVLKPIFKLL